MKASSSFKEAFLRHMLKGLKLGGVYSKSMSFQERKRAIKIYANTAMAFARGNTNWTQALVTDLSKQEKDKALMKSILGHESKRLSKRCGQQTLKSKKILRRSLRANSRIRKGMLASVQARRAENKTQVLKRLIPGGKSLDGLSLLGETLDYAIYLDAQVNLMQRIARAFGA